VLAQGSVRCSTLLQNARQQSQGRGLTPPSVFLQRVNAEFAVDAYGMGYLDPSKDPSTEPDVSHTLRNCLAATRASGLRNALC